jgi:uncharacterized membrane protein
MTLLVTTLDAPAGTFESWRSLWDGVGFQFLAFVVSFALVAAYWWGNHRFVSSLAALSPTVIMVNLVMLGFVALIPFTTEALGDHAAHDDEVATVVYAANIAIISFVPAVLELVARRDRLFQVVPSVEEVRLRCIDLCLPTVVFLVSIPIALLWSPAAARWSWLSLAVLGPVVGTRIGRRIERVRADAPAATEPGARSSSTGSG